MLRENVECNQNAMHPTLLSLVGARVFMRLPVGSSGISRRYAIKEKGMFKLSTSREIDSTNIVQIRSVNFLVGTWAI